LVGVAETNSMDPTDAAATVTVPVAVSCDPLAIAVAVITSAPEHPVAAYVALATPVIVVTGEVIVARPVAEHVEEKLTSTLWVKSVFAVPSTIDTVRLVLPPAESVGEDTAKMPSWNAAPVPVPMCTVVVPVPPPPGACAVSVSLELPHPARSRATTDKRAVNLRI